MENISYKSMYGDTVDVVLIYRCLINISRNRIIKQEIFERLGYNFLNCLACEVLGKSHPISYHLNPEDYLGNECDKIDRFTEMDYVIALESDCTKDMSDDEVMKISKDYHCIKDPDGNVSSYNKTIEQDLNECCESIPSTIENLYLYWKQDVQQAAWLGLDYPDEFTRKILDEIERSQSE